MAIKLNTPDWQTAKAATTRAATRSRAAVIPGLPAEFLTTQSSVTDEFVAEPRPQVRGAGAAPGTRIETSAWKRQELKGGVAQSRQGDPQRGAPRGATGRTPGDSPDEGLITGVLLTSPR